MPSRDQVETRGRKWFESQWDNISDKPRSHCIPYNVENVGPNADNSKEIPKPVDASAV